ncbi:MAG: peptidase S8/S53 domain-containing protein [Monoraphidium minutum]|nr:MAG: peptidase S8/S53 domain-containing protein [Monoraphidium minutum]
MARMQATCPPPGCTARAPCAGAALQVPLNAGNITIAIVDSGVEPHPDLNVVGRRTFVPGAAADDTGDSPYYKNGHGTLAAGIAAARNDGAGVWGVLPGARLLSARVLDGGGASTSAVIVSALTWLHDDPEGYTPAVINLSLQLAVGGGACADIAMCQAISRLAAKGAVVAAAAGNSRQNALGVAPACCGDAVAVTFLRMLEDGRGTYSATNWVPSTAPAADKRRTLAAPGTDILSTARGGGYASETGSSFAAPSVAGIAGRCFAAGDCVLSPGRGGENREKVLAAAWDKSGADARFRWTRRRDVTVAVPGERFRRHLGPMAWADFW